MDEEGDQLFYDMMKVYLAQMNSAVKISKILCEHSSEERELTGDDIICGLVYRLMVPMKQEEIDECMDSAEEVLCDDFVEEEEEEEEEEEGEEEFDPLEEKSETPKILRKIKSNNCNCEVCSRVRVCLCNYNSFEPMDQLCQRFKDSIEHTCSEHKIYI